MLLQMLSNTPLWVYLLLAYLVMIGIRARNTRVVPLKKLCIMPVIFTVLSLHTLLSVVTIDIFSVSVWGIACLIGGILGWWQIYRLSLRVDRNNLLIERPGSWVTLILILIIFITKYYFDYELAVRPDLMRETGFEFSMLAVSAICTGLFLGRLACYAYRLQMSDSVDLSNQLNN